MTGVGDTEPDDLAPLDEPLDGADAPDGLLDAVAEPVEELGPRAVHTRDGVLELGQPRPTYRSELAAELRAMLEQGLAPVVARLEGDDTLTISKHHLATVFDCERRFVARDEFVPSIANVRGTVAHRALARLVIEGRSA